MGPDHELEVLRARVAHLESLVEQMANARTAERVAGRRESSPAPSSRGFDRRRMLRNGLGLSAAAVAGVSALDAVSSGAAAATGDAVMVAQGVSPSLPSDPATRIFNPSSTTHAVALFQVDNTTDSQPTAPVKTRAAIVATMGGSDTSSGISPVAILGMSSQGPGVQGTNDGSDTGVVGVSTSGTGISGSGGALGVLGTGDNGPGVKGLSTSDDGVYGEVSSALSGASGLHGVTHSQSGNGVLGEATSGGAGVLGKTSSGIGVVGTSDSYRGVSGIGGLVGVYGSSMPGTGVSGVSAAGAGVSASSDIGTGLVATSNSGEAINATSTSATAIVGKAASQVGVLGTSDSGIGVSGSGATGLLGAGTSLGVDARSTAGTALRATATKGLGARLQGGAAAVQLVPQSKAGAPTTGKHEKGELLVDSAGKLWMCTKGGSPGTWRQLAFA